MSDPLENWISSDKRELSKRIQELTIEIDKLKESHKDRHHIYSAASVVVLLAAIAVFIFGSALYALLLILGAGLIKLYATVVFVNGQLNVIVCNQLIHENVLRYLFSELAQLTGKYLDENKSS